jgi:hypothetical protein
MRVGSKGDYIQWVRDLNKAAWFLQRAAGIVQEKYKSVQTHETEYHKRVAAERTNRERHHD